MMRTFLALVLTSALSTFAHASTKALSTHIETFRVDRSALDVLDPAPDPSDPAAYRNFIRLLVDQKKAELLTHDVLLTNSGDQGVLTSGRTIVAPDSITNGEISYKESFIGSRVTIKAMLGGNDFVIDSALEYQFTRVLGSEIIGKVGGENVYRPQIESLNYNLPTVTQYDGYLMLLGQSASVDGNSLLVTFDQVCVTDATGGPLRGECN